MPKQLNLSLQKEREPYEVIVEGGKLIYRKSGLPVETEDGTKWIFVLSTTRNLYIGQKEKGQFQHSSFVAGGATIAAGRVVAHNGVLEVYIFYAYIQTIRSIATLFIYFIESAVQISCIFRRYIEEKELNRAICKKVILLIT